MTIESMKAAKEIDILIDRAGTSEKSEDALRFSQAACNVANAVSCLINAELAKFYIPK